jgi:hypothetical protein
MEAPLLVFTVGCDTDQRDRMEALLQQTQGIGSTFYAQGKAGHDIQGLWVMAKPNQGVGHSG